MDDLTNYTARVENHEPLKEIPAYEAQDYPKIVSSTRFIRMKAFQNENFHIFQSLNDPDTDCTNSDSYCIAALQQKQLPDSDVENLREEPAKVIPLNYKITFIKRRPNTYKSKTNTEH